MPRYFFSLVDGKHAAVDTHGKELASLYEAHLHALRMCGVDLMIRGDISEAPKKYWVLEINAAPGLDHYVRTGPAQKKIVEDLYLRVLKSLER